PWGQPHEAAGIHRTSRQRCSRMAARGACAASRRLSSSWLLIKDSWDRPPCRGDRRTVQTMSRQKETLTPPLTPKSLPPARAKVVTAFTIALILAVMAVATPPATLPSVGPLRFHGV